jgi:hypothetical protein
MKKLRENLAHKKILEIFSKKAKGLEIIAQFVSLKKLEAVGDNGPEFNNYQDRQYAKLNAENKVTEGEKIGARSIIVEYFTKK